MLKNPDKVRESWNKLFRGSVNSHQIAVLEEGLKYQPIGISPDQAQFLETRKFQLNEIARIFPTGISGKSPASASFVMEPFTRYRSPPSSAGMRSWKSRPFPISSSSRWNLSNILWSRG